MRGTDQEESFLTLTLLQWRLWTACLSLLLERALASLVPAPAQLRPSKLLLTRNEMNDTRLVHPDIALLEGVLVTVTRVPQGQAATLPVARPPHTPGFQVSQSWQTICP